MKIRLLFFLPILLIISSLNSCGKSDESSLNLSALSFIHAAPGLVPVDLYLNGSRVNGDSLIAYNDTIPYSLLSSGTLSVVVKKYISSTTYISTSVELESEKNYSLFIIGKPNEVSYLLTNDDLSTPSSGKAKIRFLNLSPDAPSLSFKLNANTLFGTIPFKGYSDFNAIDPGDYIISINNATNGAVLSEQSITVEAGKVYSIWAKGLINTSESDLALSMRVITLQP